MPNYLRAVRQARADGDMGAPGDPITFVASTAGVKRDGLDINQNLWHLENYRTNPVFLWGHDYMGARLPIGRTEVEVVDGRLMARVTFDQQDDFARSVESKYRRGFLHTVSVGWDDIQVEGQTRHDLLDLSGVPVPGDPDAVIERQRSALASLQRNIDAVLDEGGDDAPAPPETADLLEATPAPIDLTVHTTIDTESIAEAVSIRVLEAIESHQTAVAPSVWTTTSANSTTLAGVTKTTQGDDAEPGTRAGAVLSKRMTQDIEQAVELLQRCLDRANKDKDEHGQRGQEPDATAAGDGDIADNDLVDDADSEPEGGADGDGGQRGDEVSVEQLEDLLAQFQTAALKRGRGA